MKHRAAFVIAATTLAAHAAGAQVPDLTPYLMEREAEVALARTAAPKEVSDSARVLVLTRSGFVEAERGSNGFTCVVMRSFATRFDDPAFWNPKVRAPHCFNPPAVRTILPALLKQAEWVLSGMKLTDVAARIKAAYASRELPMPETGAMAYMLSPRQHLVDADPAWLPHLMFYYDKRLSGATFGAGGMTAPVIDASAGDTTTPVMTLLVPTHTWSNGAPSSHKGKQ